MKSVHDTTVLKTAINDFFEVCLFVSMHLNSPDFLLQLKGKYDILDHLYEKFCKEKIAKLCKQLATIVGQ